MSQYIRSRLGSVAGIVVTDFSSVIVEIVSAACVSVVFVFFIEQIIDGAPYGYRLYFRQLEGIGQIQSCLRNKHPACTPLAWRYSCIAC